MVIGRLPNQSNDYIPVSIGVPTTHWIVQLNRFSGNSLLDLSGTRSKPASALCSSGYRCHSINQWMCTIGDSSRGDNSATSN
ncbi:hypothetical protein BVRB_031480, partial [Beta vulgaris subsp. vulgaris]